ncbi:hypothetical protein BESB_061290 [Besnoitia besnoiti]|uniref:Transmembrane protein n=1 Tax=Besnoitia besnoiti TaxID=94643 RepID=A0A2A9MIM7_BESBE|nr:hypothetical protein BESB_061290 [Besnoitia besnoiti]PFH35242.1 hypothetical protein BESB_061290 [Besnoitia besnoiti]
MLVWRTRLVQGICGGGQHSCTRRAVYLFELYCIYLSSLCSLLPMLARHVSIRFAVFTVTVLGHVNGLAGTHNEDERGFGGGSGATVRHDVPNLKHDGYRVSATLTSEATAATSTSDGTTAVVEDSGDKNNTGEIEAAPRLLHEKARNGKTKRNRRRLAYAAGVAAGVLLGVLVFRKARRWHREKEDRNVAMAATYLHAAQDATNRIAKAISKAKRDAQYFIPHARNAEVWHKGTPREAVERKMREDLEALVGMLEREGDAVAAAHKELRDATDAVPYEMWSRGQSLLTQEEVAEAAEHGRLSEARHFWRHFAPAGKELRESLIPQVMRLKTEVEEARRTRSPNLTSLLEQLKEAKNTRTARRVDTYLGSVVGKLPDVVHMQPEDAEVAIGGFGPSPMEPAYVRLAKSKFVGLRRGAS